MCVCVRVRVRVCVCRVSKIRELSNHKLHNCRIINSFEINFFKLIKKNSFKLSD